MPFINHREQVWLGQHGGRSELDVVIDEQGKKFVYMWDGAMKEKRRVYLPEEMQYKIIDEN